jgi:hypothetical protein
MISVVSMRSMTVYSGLIFCGGPGKKYERMEVRPASMAYLSKR